MYQEHGINPVNESYAFVLLPNRPVEDISAYSEKPDIEILAHSENLHAVYEKNLNIVALANFADQKQSVKAHEIDSYISVDKPATVISQESGSTLSIAVADPLQSSSGKVTVIVNRIAYSVIAKDDRVDVVRTSPYIQLEINTGGSKGKAISVELSMDQSDLPPPPTQTPAKPVIKYEVDSNGISISFDPVEADSYVLKYGRQIDGQSETILNETIQMGGTNATYVFDLLDDATYHFQVVATNIIGSTTSDIVEVVFADNTKDYFEFVDNYDNLDLSKIYSMSPSTGWSWGNRSDVAGGSWCLVRPSRTQSSELIYSVSGMSGFDLNAYQSGEGGATKKYADITFYTAETLNQVENNNWTQIYPGNIVATDTAAKFYTDDYTIDGLVNANYLKISIAAKGDVVWAPELERLVVRYPKNISNTIEPTAINFVYEKGIVNVGRSSDIPYSAIPSTVRPIQLSKINWYVEDGAIAEVDKFTVDTVSVKGLAVGDTYLVATFNNVEIARTPLTVMQYRPNLALNKTATISRGVTTGTVANAVDGNESTRFGYKTSIGSTPGTISFTVDLGKPYQVTDLAILWETARPKSYILEGSATGTDGDWSTISTRAQVPPSEPEWERYALESPVDTRFIRLSTNKYTSNYGLSIFEFQVFGNVPVPTIENIAISSTSITLLEGENARLFATYQPVTAEGAMLKWESNNTAVVTVDADTGHITAIGQGTALVTVKDTDPSGSGASKECIVTVVGFSGSLPIYVNSISLTPSNTIKLVPNSTQAIQADISPESAANKILTYSSSNTRIATVDKSGIITTHDKGTAVIVVRNAASGVKSELKVIVQDIDKEALQLAIATVATLTKSEYTNNSWADLQVALANATIVNDNLSATHIEVENAYDLIREAIENLVRIGAQVDKNALQLAVDTVLILIKEDYTESSWTTLQSALSNANAVLNNSGATQAEVNNALVSLQDALSALKPAEIETGTDKTALDAIIIAASQLAEKQYTTETWQALRDALSKAILISDNPNATQGEVDKAFLLLENAIAGLKQNNLEINKAALYLAISTAKQFSANSYTITSWQSLQATLLNAQVVYNNDSATQADVDKATVNLQTAIDELARNSYISMSGSSASGKVGSNSPDLSPNLSGNNELIPSTVGETSPADPIIEKMLKDTIAKLPTGSKDIVLTLKNNKSISAATLKSLETIATAQGLNLKINLDTEQDRKIIGRLTLIGGLSNGKDFLSGFNLDLTAKAEKLFQKYFENKLFSVYMMQKGGLGREISVAVKLPNNINFEDIVIYSYDSATNRYLMLTNSDPWIDRNDYLHFNTSTGGCFIISEGKLKIRV